MKISKIISAITTGSLLLALLLPFQIAPVAMAAPGEIQVSNAEFSLTEIIVKLKDETPANLSVTAEGYLSDLQDDSRILEMNEAFSQQSKIQNVRFLFPHKVLQNQVQDNFNLSQIAVLEIANSTKQEILDMVGELNYNSAIEYAEPNYIVQPAAVPNDPLYFGQWGHYALDVPDAWDTATKEGEGIVVAVIDTGMDVTHEDLDANVWTNTNEVPGNGIDDDANGFIDDINGWNFSDNNNDVTDEDGHGTLMAGLIAAEKNNNTGIAGIAPRAKIMPLKTISSINNGLGDSAAVIQAVVYAIENGAHIINTSAGCDNCDAGFNIVYRLADDAGLLNVASAGNDGVEGTVSPANIDVVMTVASITNQNIKEGQSNYGSDIDLAAPGENVPSTFLNNQFTFTFGTSPAAAHVSGVAALVLAEYPELSNSELRQLLIDSATAVSTPDGKTVGAGLVNAYNALVRIVDNDNVGFEHSGFTRDNTRGHASQEDNISDIRQSAAQSGNEATWVFTNLLDDQYRVSVAYPASSNNSQQAPFTIYDGDVATGIPQGTALIDQTIEPDDYSIAGTRWEEIPVNVNITSGTLTVKLSDMTGESGNKVVVADAIRVDVTPASGILESEISVVQDGFDSQTDVQDAGEFDFGFLQESSPGGLRFTLTNEGDVNLLLFKDSLNVTGPYTVINDLNDDEDKSVLAPGDSEIFTIEVDTSLPGDKVGKVSFVNSDKDENFFSFDIVGNVIPVLPTGQEISVSQGNTNIADGGQFSYPDSFQGSTRRRAFTINNIGTDNLTLDQNSLSVTGDFTIANGLGVSVLAPGETEIFSVDMNTSALGNKTGTVAFTNNDSDESSYNFSLSGLVIEEQVTTAPEVTVLQGGTDILNGDQFAFGDAEQGATAERTFTITNDGDGDLTLTQNSLSVTGPFTITDGLQKSTLTSGDTETFRIAMVTTSAGSKTGTVSFANSDSDEGSYSFTVAGSVTPIQQTQGPEVIVTQNNNEIADGGQFGYPDSDQGSVRRRAFVIRNDGDEDLSISNMSVTGPFVVANGLGVSVLAPGETEAFSIDVDTSTAGTKTGVLSFSNNDSDENPYNYTLFAEVIGNQQTQGPEVIVTQNNNEIADGGQFGYPDSDQGSVRRRSFVIRNDGDDNLSISNLSVTGPFAVANGLGVSVLAPGETEIFSVDMNTSALGNKAGTVAFTNNDSDENPYNFTIFGEVTGGQTNQEPEVEVFTEVVTDPFTTLISVVDGGQVQLGDIDEGTTIQQTFSITNTGDGDLNLSQLNVAEPFSLTADGLDANVLGTNDTETFTITLDTSIPGEKSGMVSFANNDSDENPYNFTIFGEVTGGQTNQEPEVEVFTEVVTDPFTTLISVVDGGQVQLGDIDEGTTIQQTFSITNTGDGDLNLSQLNVAEPFSLTADGLDANVLGTNDTETFTITLDTSIPGEKSGMVSFANNDSDENPFNFTVTASVIEDVPAGDPEISVSIGSTDIPDETGVADFGQKAVDGFRKRVFTVRNEGDGNLTLNQNSLTITGPYYITNDGLDVGTLAPGAEEQFTVFMDTSTPGDKNGTISFSNNDVDEGNYNFDAIGMVFGDEPPPPEGEPEITVDRNGIYAPDGGEFDYGTVDQGVTRRRVFTITNTGDADLTLDIGSMQVSGDFTLVYGPDTETLAPGETDTFRIDMETNTAGSKSADVSFTNSDADEGDYSFTLVGLVEGDEPPPEGEPEILVQYDGNEGSDGEPFEVGTLYAGDPFEYIFTIRNTGTADLALDSLQVSGTLSISDELDVDTLAPGAEEEFSVLIEPSGSDISGTVTISNNDSDEGNFNFDILGSFFGGPKPITATRYMDNSDPGFSHTGFSRLLNLGGYNGDVRYSPAESGKEATWRFTNLLEGRYRVSVTYPEGGNRTQQAPFSVYDAFSGITNFPEVTTIINQQVKPNSFTHGVHWQDIAESVDILSNTLEVRLNDLTGEIDGEVVLADAVRIQLLEPFFIGPLQ